MKRRGRLSKGCETCRKRKIKCGQDIPSCKQCIKAGWGCPGYGDAVDRMFQHQNLKDFNNVIVIQEPMPNRKTLNNNEKLGLSSSSAVIGTISRPSFSASSCTGSSHLVQSSHSRPSPGIATPIKDRAIQLFLTSHILNDPNISRGYFEYLSAPNLDIQDDPRLFTSISAVALAAYANTVQSTSILNLAKKYLGHAINMVNIALSTPREAVKDTTVISIMLLSTFETLTCKDQTSLVDCDTHLQGATTIIKLRGRGQLQTQVGIQLFRQMCSNVLTGCLQRSVRVPAEILELREYAAMSSEINDPAWNLSDVVVRLCEFRADVKAGNFAECREAVAAALEIDAQFSSLADTMPVSWQFRTVATNHDPDMFFAGLYHIYLDLFVAHIWNHLRTCRLLLNREICIQLETERAVSSSSSLAIQDIIYERSLTIMQQMTFEICATIPQYAGYLPNVNAKLLDSALNHDSLLSNTVPTAAGTYFVLWPLLNAGQMASSTMQRDWIIGRLHYIAGKTGIMQAYAVANILEQEEEIYVWD